jgi:hypothetical protein
MFSEWQFFDRAVCITIDPASQRVRELQQNFQAVGLVHCELLHVPRCVQSSNVGLNEDTTIVDIMRHGHRTFGHLARDLVNHHVNAVRRLYDAGCARALIFEDDARFDVRRTRSQLSKTIQWLQAHDWDIFNFGAIAFPCPVCVPVGKFVAVARRPLLAHAYALSRSGMERLLTYWHVNGGPDMHADKLLATALSPYHVAHPPICFQSVKPALFRQALTVMPGAVARLLDKGSFQDFCLRYLWLTHLAIVAGVMLLACVFTRRKLAKK